MSIFATTKNIYDNRCRHIFMLIRLCLSQDKQAICLCGTAYSWLSSVFGQIKRGKSLSLFTQFSNHMTKNLKIRVKANNSNLSPSSVRRHRTSYKQKFIIERDAKNFAYAFILANGLLHEFAKFKNTFKQEDPHLIALSFI